jgi:hypothetical protein
MKLTKTWALALACLTVGKTALKAIAGEVQS